MQHPNILIVDDSKETIIFLKIILKNLSANIIAANSGQEALELSKNKDLALAIVDVQMPEMNGYTLALKINEKRSGAIVPIIFLTAVYQDHVEILKGYESGAVDYIFKPVNKSILLSKINVFLELYKQKKQVPENSILLKKFEADLTKSKTELMDSEVKFRSFIEHAPDGVFIMNKGGHYLEVNEAVCSITGYSKEDLLGMTLHELIPAEAKDVEDTFFHKLFNSGTANTELIYRHKNGKLKWCTIFSVKLSDDQYLCFSKDITQNKAAAASLMKSEEKYRTLMNASPEGIIIVDLKGIITDVSEIGIELYGADQKEDLIGKHFFRFIPNELKDKIKEIYTKTFDEGLVQNAELKLFSKNRTPFIGEISTTLIQGKDGSPIAFMIVIHDITHRKKLERQLIHNDRMTTLGEMAAGIAHEINQPLNTLSIVFDNMLLEASKNETLSKAYLEKKTPKIYDNIFRIKNIIDHVRVFSRSQDDSIYSSFSVTESINNAVSMVSEQMRHKSIDLTLAIQNDLPNSYGNTYQFEQVVLNLLVNSKDALEEKEEKSGAYFHKTIEIKAFSDTKKLTLELTDNGSGIKPEELEKIMLPFYTTKEAGKGTGLGLSITFGIIKEMKGEIFFQSELNKGTKVVIKLPVTLN